MARVIKRHALRDDLLTGYLGAIHGADSRRYTFLRQAMLERRLVVFLDGVDEIPTGLRNQIEVYIYTYLVYIQICIQILRPRPPALLALMSHTGFHSSAISPWPISSPMCPLLDPLLEPLLDPLLEPLLEPLLDPLLEPFVTFCFSPILCDPSSLSFSSSLSFPLFLFLRCTSCASSHAPRLFSFRLGRAASRHTGASAVCACS